MSHSPPTRQLGKTGPCVPAIGLGLMGFSMHYGPPPDDTSRFAFLDRALELGATFWDTADMYGDSETLLGQYFAQTGNRDKIFLATKFGFEKGSINEINSSAAYLKQACESSLRLLQTDHIDLYYMHRANPSTPIEETMRGMLELQKEGKIKYIGLSEVSANTLRRACKVGRVDAVQIEYGPSELAIEKNHLLATCSELGVAVVAYSPLGRGLLAGAKDFSAEGDWRGMFPRFTGDLCIAWCLSQERVIPIPGTKKVRYLEENVAAAEVRLSEEEEREVRSIVAGIEGLRVPEGFEYQCFVNTVEEQ
ncbi:hypothetical protein PRZ48_013195 [Zasmidium cellare]|uniref:NADP-dependent oxidoreductase domain-containing protein n=1 Tax=Zasmidium cellare TaxID=395010 RepID=A0ABR0E3D3_ZASCE|nr:hypothetical protein PRZ48_013195 [Zasmidium cellare]